jgi:hypothetical protein
MTVHRWIISFKQQTAGYFLICLSLIWGCKKSPILDRVEQWTTYEIQLHAEQTYQNPYTDVDVWTYFVNDNGDSLVRPAFWDGGTQWKVRFAPPDTARTWSWTSYASKNDNGLSGKTGSLQSISYEGKNELLKHGLLRMSPGKRNVVQADSTPFLIVGDTPWSIPFRATIDQVEVYAKDRSEKGFNTALLITLQPDKYAEGPEARNTIEGFDRAFEDLHTGMLNKLKPDYFKTLDSLVQILIAHELVPLYAPFAHGYGWKGETAIGSELPADQYVRYCKYLVARYGSQPAFWLVNLDGNALAPGVKPGGQAIEEWDTYRQPVGLHYSPYDDYIAAWANGDSTCCFHYNRRYQEEPWLDFQWAQTGHDGLHLYHKVERMYDNQPTKAVMNGESTYEGMGGGKHGLGWWQGEDAWMQLMHGGTMGVVYGAASLWQWKITADESGWPEWTNSPHSWREALDLEGSKYVAFISEAVKGFDFTDMEKRWDLTEGNKPLLAREGKFYLTFMNKGSEIRIKGVPSDLPYFWFDPVNGKFAAEGKSTTDGVFKAPDERPWVLIVGDRKSY